MLRVFCSPSRYVQGPGATGRVAAQMTTMGLEGPALIVASPRVERMLRAHWESSFDEEGLRFAVHSFGGECSRVEIERGKAAAKAMGARSIIGTGGGKALDTARAIASDLQLPIVDAPTLASSDAPCSALSVVYREDGAFEEYRIYGRNPDLVLVDTAVIAQSPPRLLVAGMGDALATRFEAEACARSGAANMRGGASTHTALALAQLCCETLLGDGIHALEALSNREPNEALERLVEANILLSGLGFESSGLAAAHAIHNGLSGAPATHTFFHGEKVGFGLLAQLVLENADSETQHTVLDFSHRVGLPTTLADVGLTDCSSETLAAVAGRACEPGETIHNEPFPVRAADVAEAIFEADRVGRSFRPEA